LTKTAIHDYIERQRFFISVNQIQTMLEATCTCGHSEQAENKEELMEKMKAHLGSSPECGEKVEGKSEEEMSQMLDAITKEI